VTLKPTGVHLIGELAQEVRLLLSINGAPERFAPSSLALLALL
jgi:hypothetical protein